MNDDPDKETVFIVTLKNIMKKQETNKRIWVINPSRSYSVEYDDQMVPTDIVYEIKLRIPQVTYEDIKKKLESDGTIVFDVTKINNKGRDIDGYAHFIEREFKSIKTKDDAYVMKVEKEILTFEDVGVSEVSIHYYITIFPTSKVKKEDELSNDQIEQMIEEYLL